MSGGAPIAITTADFDGDGADELALAFADGRVAVKRLGPDGLETIQSLEVDGCPSAIGAGRINVDGNIDLVVAHACNSTLTVLLGAGDGTFRVAGTFRDGGTPRSVAVQETDGPGVVLIAHDSGVSAMAARPDGQLMPPVEAGWLEHGAVATSRAVDRLIEAAWGRSRERQLSLEGLTDREREVAALAVAGLTASQVGRRLHIGRRTVETHLGRAYRKLGVRNRFQLLSAMRGAPAEEASKNQ